MGEGFRFSEKSDDTDRQNPWLKADSDESKSSAQVSRVGYGDFVAPAARQLKDVDNTLNGPDPNFNDPQNPWRAGLKAAPSAEKIVPVDPSLNGPDPNVSDNPWRAGQSPRPAVPQEQRREQQPAAPSGGVEDWRRMVEREQRNGGQGLPTAPGVPDRGLNPVTEQQRQYIEESLKQKTPVFGYLATGGITGGLTNLAIWGADKKLASVPAGERTGLLKTWEGYSPMMKEHLELSKQVANAHKAHSQALAAQQISATQFGNVAKSFEALSTGVNEKLASAATTLSDDAAALLKNQQVFLSDPTKFADLSKVVANIGTAEEVKAGTKLFVANTAEAKTLTEFARISGEHSNISGAVSIADNKLKYATEKLTQATAEGPGSWSSKLLNGAAKGTLVAGATLGGGYLLDNALASQFGYEAPKTDATMRFLLDGVAVPAIILSGMETRTKIAMAGGLFLSARAADVIGGTGLFSGSAQLSSVLRPNTFDAVTIPFAAMLPVDNKWKLAAGVGLYGLGRVYNGAASYFGWSGGSGEELSQDLNASFARDLNVQSESSFDNAVDRARRLGLENERKLELQMKDWLDRGREPGRKQLEQMRGTASLAAGLGAFRLEGGSRLDLTSHGAIGKLPFGKEQIMNRILVGKNYDFGGEATTWLKMSAGTLIEMRNIAIRKDGQTVDGQLMDASYRQQLENLQNKVESNLKKIYGEHKMEDIYAEIKDNCRSNNTLMDQALVRLSNEDSVSASKDVRHLAKSKRDLAMGFLAMAEFRAESNNGLDAQVMYKNSMRYLQQAEQLERDHANLRQLKDIATRVSRKIPGATQNQLENRFNNPNELGLKR